jgi:hypothetical protein
LNEDLKCPELQFLRYFLLAPKRGIERERDRQSERKKEMKREKRERNEALFPDYKLTNCKSKRSLIRPKISFMRET